ncbi:hypothetical protein J14TS2_45540 [Bacillus sp. J14TS2]|uniref:sensor histidine kinase n=1 Tax=Bacillus sp. J14TS2 TaxID=2807188 RepID=UPI001AFD316A|nr:GHKL domain-containing protein [Bacillus sp. J14TS2]GIN74079.1 hypothetical protein J14TS2_45540 [Bacillus sp. J14TS2]
MDFFHLFAQTFLDTLSMYLLSSFIAKHQIKLDKKSIYWFLLFQLFCIIVRLEFISATNISFNQVDFLNYDILPVNSFGGVLFLLLSMLVLNSLFFKLTNVAVVFTTILTFVLWMLIRMFSVVVTGIFMEPDLMLSSYVYRVLTVLLAGVIYYKLSIMLLNSYTIRKSIFAKVMLVNTLIALLLIVIYVNFDTTILLKNILYIVIAFSFVIIINLWIVYEQSDSVKREKRVDAIEHYIPVIDEMVSEIRARQHEFNNKLLAITSIVETADDLLSAKEQIRTYTHNVVTTDKLNEVLLSDSKVIAGFLYTKMKMAELKKIQMKTEIHTSFQQIHVEEYEIVEVLGILLDNAIEACQPYDKIYVQINRVEEQIEIKVSNPHSYIVKSTFIKMFDKGYTTKNIHSRTRGFGLYNVKQIVLQCGGKLITSNLEIDGRNYVTIGVQLP